MLSGNRDENAETLYKGNFPRLAGSWWSLSSSGRRRVRWKEMVRLLESIERIVESEGSRRAVIGFWESRNGRKGCWGDIVEGEEG